MADKATVGEWNGARREMEDEGWKVVRTLRGGTKAMRDASFEFTPMTDTEQRRDREHYRKRLKRSVLFPAYTERIKSLASLPFQREPTIDGQESLPEPLQRIVANADRCGTSLASFAQKIYEDGVHNGLAIYLVDNVPVDGMPLPQVDEIDARPYFCRVIPDNLVGFQTETRHGRKVPVEIRYREWDYRPGPYGTDVLVDRIIVWNETEKQVWEKATARGVVNRDVEAGKMAQGDYELVEAKAHGFPGLPLVVFYTEKVDTLHARPAMLELAHLNIAHWNSSSLQGDALAYCRAPTRVITGASNAVAEQPVEAGAGSTVVDTSPDFAMSFVEIAGTSLDAGAAEIEKLERYMEALGMRPLMSVQGPETATGEVRADMAEKSQAQAWVEALEWTLYQGFEMAAKWIGQKLPEDFDVTLFKDSSLIAGKATDLPVLQQMAVGRMLSLPSYLREVKARGVLVTVEDIDEEVEAIRTEGEEAAQRQMDAMATRMIAERDGQPGDEDDDTEGEDDPEDEQITDKE